MRIISNNIDNKIILTWNIAWMLSAFEYILYKLLSLFCISIPQKRLLCTIKPQIDVWISCPITTPIFNLQPFGLLHSMWKFFHYFLLTYSDKSLQLPPQWSPWDASACIHLHPTIGTFSCGMTVSLKTLEEVLVLVLFQWGNANWFACNVVVQCCFVEFALIWKVVFLLNSWHTFTNEIPPSMYLMLLPSVLVNIGHQHFACAWAWTSSDMMLELMFVLGLDQMGLMMLTLLWMISMTITKRTSLHHLEQQPQQAYLSFQTENWVSCPYQLSWAMLRYWLRMLLFYAFNSQMMVLDWMLLCQQRRLQHWQEQPLPPLGQTN